MLITFASASAFNSEVAFLREDSSRPVIVTNAPSLTKAFAIARPIPRVDPATKAILFRRPRSNLVALSNNDMVWVIRG